MNLKRIAVYCGAAAGNDPAYQQATLQLADWLVANQLELVYGGGGIGLMGLLANEVLTAGGKVHGVMPKELADRGAALTKLTDLQIVANMSVRKQTMLTLGRWLHCAPWRPGHVRRDHRGLFLGADRRQR